MTGMGPDLLRDPEDLLRGWGQSAASPVQRLLVRTLERCERTRGSRLRFEFGFDLLQRVGARRLPRRKTHAEGLRLLSGRALCPPREGAALSAWDQPPTLLPRPLSAAPRVAPFACR
jgi:hypothetical protein